MTSLFRLAVASIVVHSVLFVSIFDIYFTSPVDQGMIPQYYSMTPPAKRLVLFVADGLRADTVYSLNEDKTSPAPFIREIIKEHGRWGVSHTRVPTESRPGHVALIAGLYEDVSAVTKGWQENPVEFDSVFNRSSHTWSWGSPDILPMFANGAGPGRVDTFMYDAQWEDFADSDASKLDLWVFDKVREMFSKARKDEMLAHSLSQDKVVFFLHLLGLDTNGHAHRPRSKEVMDNLKFVDTNIKEICELINDYYGDEKTAFVFTSDHGMTDWGSHGAGLPDETMTPLVAWGAGIKTPRISAFADRAHHDGWSEKWGLDDVERIDVEQADIAVLMSVLIGAAIPINSEGVVPSAYLHYNKQFVAETIFANARQLCEQFQVKEERVFQNSLPYMFRVFPKISKQDIIEKRAKIDSLVKNKQHQMAIELSQRLIDLAKEGIRYYHTYHRLGLYLVISSAFLGWMCCIILTILDISSKNKLVLSPKASKRGYPYFAIMIGIVTEISLFYQSSPLLYYLYYLLPIVCWSYAWKHRSVVYQAWSSAKLKPATVFKIIAAIFFIICGLELLVLSFFYRSVLSIILLFVAMWPYFTNLVSKHMKICVLWSLLCLSLALFPLLPVVGRNANYYLVALAGSVVTILVFILFSFPNVKLSLCFHDSKRSSPIGFFRLQTVLLAVASFVPLITNWFFSAKESIPFIVNIFSWFNLVFAIIAPNFGPQSLSGRLLYICLSYFTVFLLLSTTFEAIFVLLLCCVLCLWLTMEDMLSSKELKCTVWNSLVSHSHTKVVTLVPNDREVIVESLSVEDLRRVFFAIFFGILSFFGLGNIASINTFDPSTVYCFLTVFSPFIMGALILWKMIIPFIFVSCVFNSVINALKRSLWTSLLIILVMSDVMGLNFFFLVKDYGSWLDIGVSISHYVIIMVMAIGIVILVGVARLLTGITVVTKKSEDQIC